eukprot:CAMPEP_0177605304 /NCGR_PEP_ID=MMETSP0419_2-20121207/16627_1 /TAXON_ID=582737 /ORGANISM="Tetraselmis sp., Strain GSL018" /LENGTH=989 /DNA_ID=CAMNT_0019099439 /DNA_START=131 /DNA_END=3101 /DNA_ORIENTATION=+
MRFERKNGSAVFERPAEELVSVREEIADLRASLNKRLHSLNARLSALEDSSVNKERPCDGKICDSDSFHLAHATLPSPNSPCNAIVVESEKSSGLSANCFLRHEFGFENGFQPCVNSGYRREFFGKGSRPIAESEEPLNGKSPASAMRSQGRPQLLRQHSSLLFRNLMGAEEKTDGHGRDRNAATAPVAAAPPRQRACWRLSGSPVGAFVLDLIRNPIHPGSKFRTRWDLFVLLLLLYICVTAPVIVSFGIEVSADDNHGLWVFETLVNSLFILDILLNFNTGFTTRDDELVMSRRRIARNYLTGWFIVDLLAVLPYEYMTQETEADAMPLAKGLRLAKVTKILRVLRVIKLLRILKVPALLRQIERSTGRGTVRILTVLGGAMLILHLVACAFFYVAQSSMEDKFEGRLYDDGLTLNDFAGLEEHKKAEIMHEAWANTWVGEMGLDSSDNASRYITALYWSMSTLTTVGYGDVTPANDVEKVASMFAMVIGVTVFAYFMGTTASLITALHSTETVVSSRISQMNEFLRQRRVPRELQNKVRKFYALAAQHQQCEDEELLKQLSTPLRTELLLYLYRNALESVSFFKGQDPVFITSLVYKLRLEYYAEDDIVVQEGDLGYTMYFVSRGWLEARRYNFQVCLLPRKVSGQQSVGARSRASQAFSGIRKYVTSSIAAKRQSLAQRVAPSSSTPSPHHDAAKKWQFYASARDLSWAPYSKVSELRQGDHFGEYSCLLGQPRTATVVAMEFTELYSLSRDDLLDVYRQWPELHKEFQELVAQSNHGKGLMRDSHTDAASQYSEAASKRSNHNGSFHLFPSAGEPHQEPHQVDPGDKGESSGQGGDEQTASAAQGAAKGKAGIERPHEIGAASTEGRLARESSSSGADESILHKQEKGLKQAARLMMNMQKVRARPANPVFQLLSNGKDLDGLMRPDEEQQPDFLLKVLRKIGGLPMKHRVHIEIRQANGALRISVAMCGESGDSESCLALGSA